MGVSGPSLLIESTDSMIASKLSKDGRIKEYMNKGKRVTVLKFNTFTKLWKP